ncbi:PIN domain-containing protein [Candidatus Peregrinibacteria bacterium]|uniref:PIN domain-containing protein n=1 Tax=Candidatus Roizmanbacteria bacterium CG22_combo_CG10-13_8_21_14_all_38_20 TaxID=1974862 RepID=A0A2H0BVH2_9BACT|nr:PIN domain-containing protein [Candidatus Peregrinibacteria bacterium]PIP61682.1 MAG: hypothetical protein COW99_02835 [Candidatus Roizmanbacteria bacterium CG22_combo_CG10-13_8_21_14_all_38_20]PJC31388.1 MAG: hypothetical protein CO050_03380 [Candidatus Roizmanbacteria bacterium CG_4_9_14_0_2_um_filter_38_17]
MTIFIDTSALLALINSKDEFHKSALNFVKQYHPDLVTSSWVIEEFISHLHARYGVKEAYNGTDFIKDLKALKIVYLDKEKLDKIFSIYHEKGSSRISLVDVSNVVIMKDESLKEIFSFDRQFASVFRLTVLPD